MVNNTVVRNEKGMSSSPKSKTAKFSCKPDIVCIKVATSDQKGATTRQTPHMCSKVPVRPQGGGGHMRYSGWG